MDTDNLAALRRLRPQVARAELSLLLDHVEGRRGTAVADPYFGDESGFDATWADVTLAAAALAQKLAAWTRTNSPR
jgi:protein-tyrosine phosphatase